MYAIEVVCLLSFLATSTLSFIQKASFSRAIPKTTPIDDFPNPRWLTTNLKMSTTTTTADTTENKKKSWKNNNNNQITNQDLTPFVLGQIYPAKLASVKDFGLFVNVYASETASDPSARALIPRSQLSNYQYRLFKDQTDTTKTSTTATSSNNNNKNNIKNIEKMQVEILSLIAENKTMTCKLHTKDRRDYSTLLSPKSGIAPLTPGESFVNVTVISKHSFGMFVELESQYDSVEALIPLSKIPKQFKLKNVK
jgi:DNA-directed RNA polymerase subunit E'/Rpb7